MKQLCKWLSGPLGWVRRLFHAPVLLGIRLWIANVFWTSGVTKFNDFDNAVALFAQVYKLPFIPPYPAAALAMTAELVFPVLLVLGLMTELSAVALIFMTAVIQFLVFSNWDHGVWALFLGVLATQGAGALSLDYLIHRKCCKKSS